MIIIDYFSSVISLAGVFNFSQFKFQIIIIKKKMNIIDKFQSRSNKNIKKKYEIQSKLYFNKTTTQCKSIKTNFPLVNEMTSLHLMQ